MSETDEWKNSLEKPEREYEKVMNRQDGIMIKYFREKSGEIMIFGKKGIIIRKQVRTKQLAIVGKKIFTKIREQSKKKKEASCVELERKLS